MHKAEDVPFCAPVLSPVYLLFFSFKAPINSPEIWEVWIGRLFFKEKRLDSAFPMFVYCSRNSRIASSQIMVWRPSISYKFLALSYACLLVLITYFNKFPFIYVLLQDFLSPFTLYVLLSLLLPSLSVWWLVCSRLPGPSLSLFLPSFLLLLIPYAHQSFHPSTS